MNVTLDLTSQTPVEIDTALAEIYGRYYAVLDQIEIKMRYANDTERGLAKFKAGDLAYSSYSQESLDRLLAEWNALEGQAMEILAEGRPYQAEYRRRPWSRFYLVANNGGHIHSSMSCSTCFPTTRFGWLPQESGKDEAAAVAAHGAILCTVCYPSAPTEWTNGKKPGDEDTCTGSGQYHQQPSRTGYMHGNWGTCPGCGGQESITSTGKIRKHKKPEVVAAERKASGEIRVEGYEGFTGDKTKVKIFKTERAATNDIAKNLSSLFSWGTDHPSADQWVNDIERTVATLAEAGSDYDYEAAKDKARKRFLAEARKYRSDAKAKY